MNLRYVTFNSVTAFVVAYAVYFHDAFNLLMKYEKTHVSLFIIAIYLACTVYLGVKGSAANFAAVNFQRLELTALGLLGTIIGFILMFSHAGDLATFKANVLVELAPVFLTGAAGVGLSWLLGQQAYLCYGVYEHA
jgi:hypothetical protein